MFWAVLITNLKFVSSYGGQVLLFGGQKVKSLLATRRTKREKQLSY